MGVEELVRPVVEAAGLELWEVSFHGQGRRAVLRVMVDREGGVDLETIAEVSERLSRRLDLEDLGPAGYTLEVSSPGVERTLRTPRHFAWCVGERVKVKTVQPVQGRTVHEGVLTSAGAEAIVIAAEDGEVRVPYAEIRSARTVFVWDAARSQR